MDTYYGLCTCGDTSSFDVWILFRGIEIYHANYDDMWDMSGNMARRQNGMC